MGLESLGGVGASTSFTLAGGGGISPSAAPSGVRTDSTLSISTANSPNPITIRKLAVAGGLAVPALVSGDRWACWEDGLVRAFGYKVGLPDWMGDDMITAHTGRHSRLERPLGMGRSQLSLRCTDGPRRALLVQLCVILCPR